MDDQLMKKIMLCIPDHMRRAREERTSEPQCTGFCKLLQFSEEAPSGIKNLIVTMVMAVLGGQEMDAPASRVAGVVKNTPALIVTEGYVGVCCTSLKKLCAIMKKHILRSREAIAPLTRDPAFDGRVIPAYW